MSPVCPQLGGGCRHSPQLEGHSAFLLSTDPPPPGEARSARSISSCVTASRSPSYGILWGKVLETVTAKGSPSSPNPVRGDSDLV